MKTLYLIRHAKSSWANPGLDDIDRPLNKRGKRDAPFMGGRLYRYGVRPDIIYTSPAKRARKTAKHIALALEYPLTAIEQHGDIYTSDLQRLLGVVRKTSQPVNTLFLVGHNYVITDLAEYLTAKQLGNIPTCGIVGISFAQETWREIAAGEGTLLFFDYPKKHKT